MRLTAKEIAEILNISVRAVRKRAKKEKWPYEEIVDGGKPVRVFDVDGLGEDIRMLCEMQKMRLTAKEIAEMIGVSRQAIQKRSQKENWPYEEKYEGRGKPEKYFLVGFLPAQIRDRINATQWNLNATKCNLNATSEKTQKTASEQGNCEDNPAGERNQNREGKNEKMASEQGYEVREPCGTNGTRQNGEITTFTTLSGERQKSGFFCENAVMTRKPEKLTLSKVVMEKSPLELNYYGNNNDWFDFAKLAEATGVKKNTLIVRSRKEQWPYKIETCKGGKRKVFNIIELPEDIQSRLIEYVKLTDEKDGSEEKISQKDYEIAISKVNIIRAFDRCGSLEEKKLFVEAYNSGRMLKKTFERVGKVSLKTLYRWKKIFEESGNDFRSLIKRRKTKENKLTDDEKNYLLNLLLHQNRYKIRTAIRLVKFILAKKGIESPSSESSMYRFVKDFMKKHYDIWVLAREGEKALNDKVLPYLERDAEKLECGDVLVADGHKCNFMVVNPYTGKPARVTLLAFLDWASRDIVGWSFMFTENIEAVHLALFRAIMRLGKIPKIVYLDNGKSFRAKVFVGVKDFGDENVSGIYSRLGIKVVFALPYNAQAKPVERFFGTLESFERLLPSFSGTSIDDKPARLRRNEKFMQSISSDYVPKLEEVEKWFEQWLEFYRSQPHRGLGGRKPKDLFKAGSGVDEKDIYLLMMCQKNTKIYRNGVKLFGFWFWNEALYGLKERVNVRYDLHDLRYVLVFSEDGEFICRAERLQKVHPAAALLGDEKSYSDVKRRIAEKNKLKRLTKTLLASGLDLIDGEIDIGRDGKADEIDAIEYENKVVEVDDDVNEAEILFENETDKYFYLMERVEAKEELSDEDKAFIEEFEKKPSNRTAVKLVRGG